MSKSKLSVYGGLLLAVLVLGLGHYCWTRGVYVKITNNADTALKDVEIAYSGGTIHVGTLEPKGSYGQWVNPNSASIWNMEWFGSSGAKESLAIDVYVERNYSGSVEITVEHDGTVAVVDRVKTRWLVK